MSIVSVDPRPTWKKRLDLFGAAISFLSVFIFAIYIFDHKVPQNLASWIMWAILDILTVVTMYKSGNKQPWLPISWTIGAMNVILVTCRNGTWEWGVFETASVLGSLVAIVCWQKLGPQKGVIACIASMAIAGIPSVRDMWFNPQPSAFYMWFGLGIGAILSCIGGRAWTIQDRAPHLMSSIFNICMAGLCLR